MYDVQNKLAGMSVYGSRFSETPRSSVYGQRKGLGSDRYIENNTFAMVHNYVERN